MDMDRRQLIVSLGALPFTASACRHTSKGGSSMYGLIGKMTATSGQRDALIEILLEGINEMPGCLSYIVANDPSDPNAIWITEAWDNEQSHKASLQLPSVRKAIERAKPLIAGFGPSFVTEPVGGHGLKG
jgi:quinol monooxygenase YgiN